MSQMECTVSAAWIIIITTLVACGICCTDLEWTCDDGQCIPSANHCDGVYNCKDKSDETTDACIHIECDKRYFQCAYGACINGGAQCNGKSDCVDSSDEASNLCKDAELNTKCPEDKFQCNSDQCIDLELLCNGKFDCTDKSDETVDKCMGTNCDGYFRCGYGACIELDSKCNNLLDCVDGSDEASILCGKDKIKITTTTTTSTTTTTIPPPPKTTTPLTFEEGCRVPNISNSRIINEAEPKGVIHPNEFLLEFTVILIECDPGYTLRGQNNNICIGSAWQILPHPTCIIQGPQSKSRLGSICLAPTIPNLEMVHKFDPTKFIRPNEAVPENIPIIYKCSPGYAVSNHIENICDDEKWKYKHPSCMLSGCIAPIISNSQLTYQHQPESVIQPGKFIPDNTGIVYECNYGYTLSGTNYNICNNSGWNNQHPECQKISSSVPTSGCIAPYIRKTWLIDQQKRRIQPDERVPDNSFYNYTCDRSFTLEGNSQNICMNSKWLHDHPMCIKYCPKDKIESITFDAICKSGHTTVLCSDIKPNTSVTIQCKPYYWHTDQWVQSVECTEDGEWNQTPQSCLQECGKNTPRKRTLIANSRQDNITYVPWHVGIFHRLSDSYEQICGGSILSAKVVISAAHCFWDNLRNVKHDRSIFLVAAGKNNRNYEAYDPETLFRNISEIVIPSKYIGEQNGYQSDIALLGLTNYLIFSNYIKPLCIKWETNADKTYPSDIFGQVSGWGKTENKDFSENLQTGNYHTTSYWKCKETFADQYTIESDTFCIINLDRTLPCSGDSGGGFVVQENKTFHLYGVVSNAAPLGKKCTETDYVAIINIQYYETMITDFIRTNRII